MALHQIPVWGDLTPDEAWAEIRVFGKVPGYRWWWRFTKRLRWEIVEDDD